MSMQLVVKINGGLGNQLFQYAMGRALADTTGAELLLDLGFFDLPPGAHTPRHFELDRFHVRYTRITAEQLLPYHELRANAFKRHAARLFPFLFDRQRVVERQLFVHQPEVHQLNKSAYLDGHWQSERYFLDRAAAIRHDLRFREEPGERNRALLRTMEDCLAVSLHVRRGDYVSNAQANSVHGTCDSGYYQRAMERILLHSPDAVFHVFSDDIAWAKAHLPRLAPMVFVEHNTGVSDHFDLLLMAACRHHIIANSSFSWWGAWLNPRTDKRVIAPARWFRDPGVDTRDLIPDNWERL